MLDRTSVAWGSKSEAVEPKRKPWTRLARLACAAVFSLSAVAPPSASACLWDYDTVVVEAAVAPSELDLLSGKFLRRSPESYQWRIEDRTRRLSEDATQVDLYDDLAVAYQKTGRHDLAVETILKKEELRPGLYETYSNLGTFFILEGDFERGLPYIDQALAVNPDAHFGREKYQKWLVEYAIQRRVDGKLAFPLGASHEGSARDSFAKHLARKAGLAVLTNAELQPAIQGVMGMMRFANHRNPLLLEALGDLHVEEIAAEVNKHEARGLAVRAYLAASYEVDDSAAKALYRSQAEVNAPPTPRGCGETEDRYRSEPSHGDLVRVEEQFRDERHDAEVWYRGVKADELAWIAANADVDAKFHDKYLVARETRYVPTAFGEKHRAQQRGMSWDLAGLTAAGAGAALIGGLVLVGARRRARTQDGSSGSKPEAFEVPDHLQDG